MKRPQAGAVRQIFSLADRGISEAQCLNQDTIEKYQKFEAAFEEIRSLVKRSEEHLPCAFFRALNRPVEIASKLGYGSQHQAELYHFIRDGLTQEFYVAELEDEATWIRAFIIAEAHRKQKYLGYYSDNFLRANIVGDAFCRLEKQGYQNELGEWTVNLCQHSFQALTKEIEGLVVRLGGLAVANSMFLMLKRMEKVYEGLFLYGRSASPSGSFKEPNVPWHYLYNLSLKHLLVPKTSEDAQNDFKNLIALSQDFGATYDVEEYSSFAFVGLSPYLFEHSVHENTIYDELFSFPQWNGKNARRILDLWMDALVEVGCRFPIADASAWKAVSHRLLERSNLSELVIAHRIDFACWNLQTETEDAILKSLAIPNELVNRGYDIPSATAARNAPFYPLIRLSSGKYALPPTGIAARCLYERLSTLARTSTDKQLDGKLGKALELLTKKVLIESKNIPSIIDGQYRSVHRTRYEIDLVVETGEHIHLFECKRKVLTNQARAGQLPDAFVDLFEGFLKPLVQVTRHEIALRSSNEILFTDSNPILFFSGRHVSRIVVTMLDHGSFQNKNYIAGLLRTLPMFRFRHGSPNLTARFDPLNKILDDLVANFQKLATIANQDLGEYIHAYSFDTWWVSVDQLMTLTSEGRTLWETFKPVRNVVFSTGDLINEFYNAQKLGLGKV